MLPTRLVRNLGSYLGERIEIRQVLTRLEAAARRHGWTVETVHSVDGFPIHGLSRPARTARRTVYLSAGIHGDEPAGPLAALQLLEENAWPDACSLWFCPCLNPAGFEANSRGNRAGIDLNRDYRDPQADETRAHIAWLGRQPEFDFALCLHEDWESAGFYTYEIRPEDHRSLARPINAAVERLCPIDRATEIDGWPAHDGVIEVSIPIEQRPQWPEALYLRAQHTKHTCTLEAPSDFALEVRVAALAAGVRAALAAPLAVKG